jgi:hypothetical protein
MQMLKNFSAKLGVRFGAAIRRATGHSEGVVAMGRWTAVCRDKDGNVRWSDTFKNIVVTEGLNELLTMGLKNGTPEANWYIGLKDTGTPVAGDTLASHGSWAELAGGGTLYTGDRKAWVGGTVSGGSVDNVGNEASFAIVATDDVYGAFLCNVATTTTGKLYAVGDFSGGARSVQKGDTLEVTATFTTADDGV